MAEDFKLRFQRIVKLATRIWEHHTQVDEMMALMIQDGLGAMAYGQYGGSTPDPTARTVFDVGGSEETAVKWRKKQAELDRIAYWANLAEVEKGLERMDEYRRRYMSANMDIRNRMDPSDWCRIHWALHLYEGHRRRAKGGDLCNVCYAFQYGDDNTPGMGREPSPTEADYFHRHGRWPHRPVDPKERRAV